MSASWRDIIDTVRYRFPSETSDFDEAVAELTHRTVEAAAAHREMFSAAYFTRTHLDPREAVLVERHDSNGYRWYFTSKADIRGHEDVEALLAENAVLTLKVARLEEELAALKSAE